MIGGQCHGNGNWSIHLFVRSGKGTGQDMFVCVTTQNALTFSCFYSVISVFRCLLGFCFYCFVCLFVLLVLLLFVCFLFVLFCFCFVGVFCLLLGCCFGVGFFMFTCDYMLKQQIIKSQQMVI